MIRSRGFDSRFTMVPCNFIDRVISIPSSLLHWLTLIRICPSLYSVPLTVDGTLERGLGPYDEKAHTAMFIYLLKYWSNIGGHYWPVLWVNLINKDAASIVWGTGYPSQRALIKTASCKKALPAAYLLHLLFVLIGKSTQRLAQLKDANSNTKGSDC